MLKIVGYSDRLSAAPGEVVRFMVNCHEARRYQARLVRIIHGDINPAGPGLKVTPIKSSIDGAYDGRAQRTQMGSFVRVPAHPRLERLASFTLLAMVWPTTPGKGRQALITKWDAHAGAGYRFELGVHGGLSLTLGDGADTAMLRTNAAMLERRWYLVAASYDAASGRATLIQRPLAHWPHVEDGAEVSETLGPAPALESGPLVIAGLAGADGLVGDVFNGKIDSPAIFDRALDTAALDAAFLRPMPESLRRSLIAAWDFAQDIPSARAVDIGPHGLGGALINLPARGVTGWRWTGEAMDWRARPEHYGAIHFHDDDIYDCGWTVDFALRVPLSLKSGAYAAHVWCGEAEDGTEEDYITFFVRPPRGPAAREGRPKAVFLAPTASYLAYANDHTHMDAALAEMVMGRLTVVQLADIYMNAHREIGHALYDTHADGSGVCYSSYLRPILNLRPKYSSWLGGQGSGLWQFNADTHLLDWLDHEGIEVDIVTDEDLEREGAALLEPYRVVLTGTHPEYHSKAMSDAMVAFLGRGGRLMYLGANGWYWRIAWHPTLPGVIEVRRAEGGTRAWAAEPGEYHHSFTGELGGLWRRNGRPPNEIVGVGFTCQGFDISSHFRRAPGADDPRAAFIFEGVDDEIIGDFGLIGGGAAGLELDRVAHILGTPPNILVLASSENHTDLYLPVLEESFVMTPELTGSQSDRARADLTFFETAAGGAVFSASSIAWCGGLSHNGYENSVARITGNVLRRFLDAAEFDT